MHSVRSLDVQWKRPTFTTVEFPYIPEAYDHRGFTEDISLLEFQVTPQGASRWQIIVDGQGQNPHPLFFVQARAFCGIVQGDTYGAHYEIVLSFQDTGTQILSDGGELLNSPKHTSLGNDPRTCMDLAEAHLLRHLEILRVAGILPPTW